MSLQPGTRLGPFEILSLLGAGGMGEVYRAQDTRLGRTVALKVLPSELTGDPGRSSRFAREAQLLAALNHPNIAQIYGREDAAGGMAIIMECVEGPTLAERLRSGRLPVSETVAIARQIAEALDAAHERGIIHRDLKPANIKIRDDGSVKVLDFGIAKALPPGTASVDVTEAPTSSSPPATRHGAVLGTAAYMSPEQARGRTVDARTDIWAFGCVLYEMLTGRSAFGAESTADTVAAVLERDPDWTQLPQGLPAPIDRVVRRSLVKDPTRRLRAIGDARLDLDEPVPGDAMDDARAVAGRPRGTAVLVAGSLAVGLAAGALTFHRAAPELMPGPRNETFATQLTDYGASEVAPTISPDGRVFAFVSAHGGSPDVWLRQVSGGDPVRLTDDAAVESELAFARDGETIFFTRTEASGSSIWQVGTLGGQPRKVVAIGMRPSPSPDGRQLAYAAMVPPGAWKVSLITLNDSQTRDVLPSLAGEPQRVSWAPDSRRIAYTTGGLFEAKNLVVVDLATGQHRQASHFTRSNEGISEHAWLPDGSHIAVVYSPSATITSNRPGDDLGILNIETGRVSRMTMNTGQDLGAPSLSADGSRLVATASEAHMDIWSVPVTDPDPVANGKAARQVVEASAAPAWPFLSRDGRTLLFNGLRSGSANLWLRPLRADGPERQITFVPGKALAHSSLSPEGGRVAFVSSAAGQSDIWTQNVDGTDLRQLTSGIGAASWPTWSPDGRTIVVTVLRSGRYETWTVPAAGGPAEFYLPGFFRGDWQEQPSGRGTWLVTSDGTNTVRLIDFEQKRVVWEETIGGVFGHPMFSPDMRSFSVITRAAGGSEVIVVDLESRARRTAASLPFTALFRASWTDDGRAVVVNRVWTLAHVVLFDGFWTSP
jgi:eukaryotic-like serine/threonine-protein kinase